MIKMDTYELKDFLMKYTLELLGDMDEAPQIEELLDDPSAIEDYIDDYLDRHGLLDLEEQSAEASA